MKKEKRSQTSLEKKYSLFDIAEIRERLKGRLFESFPLERITSFGVGGEADILFYPKDITDIVEINRFTHLNGIPITFIGRGTNILVRDGGIRGVVVVLRDGIKDINIGEKHIEVGACVSLTRLLYILMKNGISGLEFAWGIPGTFGGAIAMNAGAFGSEISQFLERVVSIDLSGNKKIYNKGDMKFSYRYSSFQDRKEVIVLGRLSFKKRKDPREIYKKMKEFEDIRGKNQPIGAKTAGSIFKNPKGDFAGRIIEKLGLKGVRIGDAVISMIHANFIENVGNASAKDIENLIEYVETYVEKKTGIVLAREIKILGNEC